MPSKKFAKVIAITAVSAFFSVVFLSGFDNGFAQTSRESSLQLWQKTFDVVWKTVNEKYFDPSFGGVDWVAIRQRYAPQIAEVRTEVEFRDLLTRMLGEIKISHLRILDFATLEKSMARAVVTRGLALRDIDNHVIVTRVVDDSPAATAGLRSGFLLQAIDGVAVENARNAERKLADDSEKHRLTILDETDKTREVTIEHRLPPADKV